MGMYGCYDAHFYCDKCNAFNEVSNVQTYSEAIKVMQKGEWLLRSDGVVLCGECKEIETPVLIPEDEREGGAWNMWQQAQKVALPDGFVLALKELPQAIAEELALDRVNKPFGETDPTWLEITEKVYQEHLRNKEFELCRDYKAMIEAREQVQ